MQGMEGHGTAVGGREGRGGARQYGTAAARQAEVRADVQLEGVEGIREAWVVGPIY